MLTKAFKSAFERTQLKEPEIFQYEEMLHTTTVQDLTNISQYVIETRMHSADSFMLLDDAYLLVKFKVVKSDDTALGAGELVSLTHGAWSLFSRVDLELNQIRVDYNENPGQTANVLHKVSKSYDWIVDNGPIEFYYPAGFSNGLATVGTLAQGATDSNWLAGANRLSESKSVWAKLPLKHVLGFANIKQVLHGVNVLLRLEKQSAYNEILMSDSAVTGKTVVEALQLYVPTVKAGPRLANEFMEKLKNRPMYVDWQQIYFSRLSSTGTASVDINLHTGAKRPRHLFLMPQLQSQLTGQDGSAGAVNGGVGRVNTVGGSETVSEVFVTLNGIQYPFVKFNGSSTGYIREVTALKKAFGKDKGGDSSSIVRVDNFDKFNSIWYFDLSHADDIFEQNNVSDAIVRITFVSSEVADKHYNCVLLHDMHHKLEMHSSMIHISQA